MATVWVKTAKGREEVGRQAYGLAVKLRQVLIMIDGKRDPAAGYSAGLPEGVPGTGRPAEDSFTLGQTLMINVARRILGIAGDTISVKLRAPPDGLHRLKERGKKAGQGARRRLAAKDEASPGNPACPGGNFLTFLEKLFERGGEMDNNFSAWARGLAVFGALLVSACVSTGGNLKPGASTLPEVIAEMGPAAMTWKNPDGSEQLAFPRGPAGTQTFMAHIGPDGKLQRVEQVLDTANFSRVQAGMSKVEVLRILGPSGSRWTEVYTRSNQLAWSWLTCDNWNMEEFFDVMFDLTSGLVRSTGRHPHLVGTDGIQPACSH